MIHQEQRLQQNFAVWLTAQGILFCASSGGMHTPNKRAAGRMKAAGYKAGFPDLFIYEPRGGFHGMSIEVKVRGSRNAKVEDSQSTWAGKLAERGYHAVIVPVGADYWKAWSFMEDQVTAYMAGNIKKEEA